MLIDQTNIREMVRSMDRSASWHIECNKNTHSICALGIFTEILKKETIKYEIGFASLDKDVNFALCVGGEEHVLSNEVAGMCSCPSREIAGVAVVYGLAKSLDFLTESTLWPMAIAYSFYREFACHSSDPVFGGDGLAGHEEQENAQNAAKRQKSDGGAARGPAAAPRAGGMCAWCVNMRADIVAQVKIMNCQCDGVFYEKNSVISFLRSSCLFSALRNDISFVFAKRLFNSRSRQGDRKLCEILAKAGISIASANENYMSVGRRVQEIVDRTFGVNEAFVYRNGHDLEVQAIEHAMLIYFYLYKGHGLYALLSLRKKRLVDSGKATRFYQNVVRLFKDAVTHHKMIGRTALFQIKGLDFAPEEACVLFELLGYLVGRYLVYRYPHTTSSLILGDIKAGAADALKKPLALFSTRFKNAKLRIEGWRRVSDNLVVVDAKDLGSVIGQVFPDK